MVNLDLFKKTKAEFKQKNVTLVAVSKSKPAEDIQIFYKAGQRVFGENYVQELLEKKAQLPEDIEWHLVGHLQTNKVKEIAPFISLIHGVDSLKLLKEINKEARKNNRVIDCLIQVHIAQELTKFGMNEYELSEFFETNEVFKLQNVSLKGFMGVASLTTDKAILKKEFQHLKKLSIQFALPDVPNPILSMGMTADYKIAIEEGSNMVRLGSMLFGEREKLV
jgi:PLP dependent protein